MIKYEDECCGCAVPAYPCIGLSCPRRNVPYYYCDKHDNEEALYHGENADYCERCADAYLQEIFNDLTIFEKAELLNITLKKID